jgi:hypothetical protein
MPSPFFGHAANVLGIALLISIVTGSAAIAASGIGHALAGRTSAACAAGLCGLAPHQAKSAHLGKVNAVIALRGRSH